MTISELQTQAEQASERARTMLARFQSTAAAEGRVIGPGEKAAFEAAIAESNSLRARLNRARGDANMNAAIDRMTGDMTSDGQGAASYRGGGANLGAQFIGSATYQWLRKNLHALPTGAWTSPSSELMAATLTEDSASGGGLIVPHYVPGILPLPTRPLVMADLIAPGTTDSNVVSYMAETAFVNAAAAVLEAGTKPESTLVFTAKTEAVKKIAHWIPVTEELLEDQAAAQSYIDTRLRLGVALTEDDELLNGSGVAPHLNGFLVRAGLAAAVARGADSNADAILRQIAAIFTATGLQPDGIVMAPGNWLTIQMLKTSTGEYISGQPPFAAPHGPTLWGLPVALTPAIPTGTALVGAFKTAAQLFRRGGLRVEASNSHANFFIENKIALRAEERLALVAYREAAFGKVTGLN